MQDYFQDNTVRNNLISEIDAEYIGGSRRYIRMSSGP